MDYIPYNSRNPLFKSPFSAVRAGETITLQVILPRSLQCSGVCFVIHKDGGEEKRFSMRWYAMEGWNDEWWRLEFVPKESGLFYYRFDYDTQFGTTSIKQ